MHEKHSTNARPLFSQGQTWKLMWKWVDEDKHRLSAHEIKKVGVGSVLRKTKKMNFLPVFPFTTTSYNFVSYLVALMMLG